MFDIKFLKNSWDFNRPFSKTAAENSDKSKLKTYTCTR